MINFDDKYFQKINFTKEQINYYFSSAKRDLEIAKESKRAEVVFKFSYDALIKLGIALIAEKGRKVRSAQGHHIKILEKMSKILKNEEIEILGNKIRQDRNHDLYDGEMTISEKQTKEYLKFVAELFHKLQK